MVALSTQQNTGAAPGADSPRVTRSLNHEHRFGSLEAGKRADVVLQDDAPLDPRSRAEFVSIEGRIQYDLHLEGRRF